MGAAKDMWMEEIENTVDRFVGGNLTEQEAFQILVKRFGFDQYEAQTMLREAVS